jgi:hypothetical protein
MIEFHDAWIEIDAPSQLFPDVEEVKLAIIKAKRIFDFVKSKLPAIQRLLQKRRDAFIKDRLSTFS